MGQNLPGSIIVIRVPVPLLDLVFVDDLADIYRIHWNVLKLAGMGHKMGQVMHFDKVEMILTQQQIHPLPSSFKAILVRKTTSFGCRYALRAYQPLVLGISERLVILVSDCMC